MYLLGATPASRQAAVVHATHMAWRAIRERDGERLQAARALLRAEGYDIKIVLSPKAGCLDIFTLKPGELYSNPKLKKDILPEVKLLRKVLGKLPLPSVSRISMIKETYAWQEAKMIGAIRRRIWDAIDYCEGRR